MLFFTISFSLSLSLPCHLVFRSIILRGAARRRGAADSRVTTTMRYVIAKAMTIYIIIIIIIIIVVVVVVVVVVGGGGGGGGGVSSLCCQWGEEVKTEEEGAYDPEVGESLQVFDGGRGEERNEKESRRRRGKAAPPRRPGQVPRRDRRPEEHRDENLATEGEESVRGGGRGGEREERRETDLGRVGNGNHRGRRREKVSGARAKISTV